MMTLESQWKTSDYLGALRVRLGIRRNQYKVNPGLYRRGNPDRESPVFVTANYKLTVDHLRRALNGIDSWILVLDTKGVNVWCAAGKGTFGTDELVRRVDAVQLDTVVSHRNLILPQLGAPGIDPVQVKKGCGFKVSYGPVEARDLPAYLERGGQATPEMRRKDFPLSERLAVSLTHFSQGILSSLAIGAVLFLLERILLGSWSGAPLIPLTLGALFTGSILTGALLPVLPGRAFSMKGFVLGFLIYPLVFLLHGKDMTAPWICLRTGQTLILHCWIVFQALNLTGSSTYTSLSGVQKEMSVAVPLLIGGCAAGLALLITGGVLS